MAVSHLTFRSSGRSEPVACFLTSRSPRLSPKTVRRSIGEDNHRYCKGLWYAVAAAVALRVADLKEGKHVIP